MSLEQVRDDWTRLGTEAPLWAVLTGFGDRGAEWPIDEFMATGVAQIGGDLKWAESLAGPVGRRRALDFGCGVGRLSNALAEDFAEVVGVDIAEPMLAEARRLDRSGGRIRYVHNAEPDLRILPTGTFDFVYTDLVLQHVPARLQPRYLDELLRVTRPGGCLVIGVPERGHPVLGPLLKAVPRWLDRAVQRRLLGFPAPMAMNPIPGRRVSEAAARGGGTVRDTRRLWDDPLWRQVRYVIAKSPVGARAPLPAHPLTAAAR
ncbi:methyltransferase family protein [Murinocardiopsis flavida]|uniref:Methyltransferase family protein n=1 Tax=Murinocardiopsis flavida TaxID=645275 RepID=A0A2P8DDS2_9ACTN|nr:class I SAM-dependent methyltransferase [Murinocardiopsis flavida]PSK95381.1 methyltransferase family protein [Murinocardiopsis flavida]